MKEYLLMVVLFAFGLIFGWIKLKKTKEALQANIDYNNRLICEQRSIIEEYKKIMKP